MSTPAVFLERWGAAGVEATVPAGAAGLPVAIPGFAENWVMAGGWAGFPAADSIGDPTLPRLFRIFDPADPREIMRVRQTSGSAWLVVRGDQGTLPVAHAPGFTVRPFITAAGLGALAQGVPSRDGLVLPNRGIIWTSNTDTHWDTYYGVAALDPVAGDEISRGCTYELMAAGRFTLGTLLTTPPRADGPSFNCAFFYPGYYNPLMWGEENHVGQIICPMQGATRTDARFWLHGIISLYPGRVTTSITVHLAPNYVPWNGPLPPPDGPGLRAVQAAQTRMFGPTGTFAATTDTATPPGVREPKAVALVIKLVGNSPSNFDVYVTKSWRSG